MIHGTGLDQLQGFLFLPVVTTNLCVLVQDFVDYGIDQIVGSFLVQSHSPYVRRCEAKIDALPMSRRQCMVRCDGFLTGYRTWWLIQVWGVSNANSQGS